MIPKAGEVVRVTGRCGAQFRDNTLTVRVIRTGRYGSTPEHMLYLIGYVLGAQGNPVARRELLIEHDGLELVKPEPARNGGPARVPKQRTGSVSPPSRHDQKGVAARERR